MQSEKLIIMPYPKELHYYSSFYEIKENATISIPYEDSLDLLPIAQRAQKIIKGSIGVELPITNKNKSKLNHLFFERDADLPEEGYFLRIAETGILIGYSNCAGAFHAVSTLLQIIRQCGNGLPCLHITDKPDFAARGIMLDISRNKVPKQDTLYRIVDLMADLKLNQLQLYIEGFSFAYPTFPEVWKDKTPMTGEEIMLLDKYCKERFIDLVPNQNSFGHMGPWLARKEFADLSECPDGCEAPWGWYAKPLTLNPLDPGSIQLVERMMDDLLPNFTSDLFNIGCDETFELGQGRSRALCEEIGKGRVYFDFLMKIYELVKKRGKKMMFWGDIILEHSELVPELPKDVIALEWGYTANMPSAEHCEQFSRSNIPFYVCPGTSSCNSITGLTEIMKSNQRNAAVYGMEYGAIGYLNTDWGEGGHWQCLPISYPSFGYGAALSWGFENNKEADLAGYLNRFVFQDSHNKMGQFVLDAGNYYLQEEKSTYHDIGGGGIFRTLYVSQLNDENKDLDFLNLNKMDVSEFTRVKDYIYALQEDFDMADMRCEDAEIITAEYRHSLRLVLHGANLGLFKLGTYSEAEQKDELEKLLEDITGIIKDYKEIWLKRNKSGGLENSVKRFEELQSQYVAALNC